MKSKRFSIFFILIGLVYIHPLIVFGKAPGARNLNLVFNGTIMEFSKNTTVNEATVWIRNRKTRAEFYVVTDENGRFSKDRMKKGLYDVCVRKNGYYSPHHMVLIDRSVSYYVDPATRRCSLDFSIVPLGKDIVTGVVYDDDGYHVTNAVIHPKGSDVSLKTDKYGTYVIEHPPSGLKTISVSADGFFGDEYYLLGLEKDKETFNIGLKKLAKPIQVGPDGWTDARYAGTRITIPKGALDRITDIRITKIPTQFIELNEDGIPVSHPVSRFDFKPAGLKFKKPIKITTPALIPKKFSPEEDTKGNIPFFDSNSGKTEKIQAVYRHADHTVEYEIRHFSSIPKTGGPVGTFFGNTKRVEKVEEVFTDPDCHPGGCSECVSFTYYPEWRMKKELSFDLDFGSVRIQGVISDKVDSCDLCIQGKKSIQVECDAGECRTTELHAGGRVEYTIDAYRFNPWFSGEKGYVEYVTRKTYEKPEYRCVPGDPCGEGEKCADDPSECCYRVCSKGACDAFEQKPEIVDCRKCGPGGKCIPDESMPCSDNDPCTVNDRCIFGKCVGIPVASPDDPNCGKKQTGADGGSVPDIPSIPSKPPVKPQ